VSPVRLPVADALSLPCHRAGLPIAEDFSSILRKTAFSNEIEEISSFILPKSGRNPRIQKK